MEALTLQNARLAAAHKSSSANKSRTCALVNGHCRIAVHRICTAASLGNRARVHKLLRPCGSFSSESDSISLGIQFHLFRSFCCTSIVSSQEDRKVYSVMLFSAAAASATDQPELNTQYEEGLDLDESIAVLKKAAKTRKVSAMEVLAALRAVEKAKVEPSSFLATIGGSPEAPGPRTWMLVFTSSKEEVSESSKGGMGKGSYFPITAVQKFDATAMTIENGAYLGPLGCLTFEGRMSWKGRILAFLFDSASIKIGSLGPFKFNIAKKEDKDRVPTNKDPFFVWHYADDEIIVARGRGGGLAFWCRCERVPS